MGIESAFRKVSEEIGVQSIALAEELSLTTAELSYLQDRRKAYENLGDRTGLDGVRGRGDQPDPGREIRHAARQLAARAGTREPRHAHVGGGEEGGRTAAEAHRPDDPVLSCRCCSRSSSRLRRSRWPASSNEKAAPWGAALAVRQEEDAAPRRAPTGLNRWRQAPARCRSAAPRRRPGGRAPQPCRRPTANPAPGRDSRGCEASRGGWRQPAAASARRHPVR